MGQGNEAEMGCGGARLSGRGSVGGAMRLPLTLVPYDAACAVMIDQPILDGMSARGGAWRWVAGRSRAWLAPASIPLTFWRRPICCNPRCWLAPTFPSR